MVIEPLKGYFAEQFRLNDTTEALPWWQVWDRTANRLVPAEQWRFDGGKIVLSGAVPWHRYTASFLCWRIREEINMYNHTTNHWASEHLRQLDPRHPLAWEYLQKYMDDWCAANPQTNVVRLTSLFYNFVWIFGDDARRPSRFVDWASYDFTVSPAALRAFEAEYGYALTAEDFINKGLLQATHRTPSACPGGDTFFRMAHVLGVDEDDGRYACQAKWENGAHPEELNPALRWTDPAGRIVSVGPLMMAVHAFGRGTGAYPGGFTCSPESANALLQALVMLSRTDAAQLPACGHPCVETAWFPASKTLVVMNNSEEAVTASIDWMGRREIALEPMEMRFVQV